MGTHLPMPDLTSEAADSLDSLFTELTTEAEVVRCAEAVGLSWGRSKSQ